MPESPPKDEVAMCDDEAVGGRRGGPAAAQSGGSRTQTDEPLLLMFCVASATECGISLWRGIFGCCIGQSDRDPMSCPRARRTERTLCTACDGETDSSPYQLFPSR
jgi:hypothetical protein